MVSDNLNLSDNSILFIKIFLILFNIINKDIF